MLLEANPHRIGRPILSALGSFSCDRAIDLGAVFIRPEENLQLLSLLTQAFPADMLSVRSPGLDAH